MRNLPAGVMFLCAAVLRMSGAELSFSEIPSSRGGDPQKQLIEIPKMSLEELTPFRDSVRAFPLCIKKS